MTVTGNGGVPATGVSAVVLNVTAVGPAAAGYLTAYPQGTTAPTASNLNYQPGETLPNRVIVPVSATGQIDITANQATDVLVDVSGWYSAAGGTGTEYTPGPPRSGSATPGPATPRGSPGPRPSATAPPTPVIPSGPGPPSPSTWPAWPGSPPVPPPWC